MEQEFYHFITSSTEKMTDGDNLEGHGLISLVKTTHLITH